MIVVEDTFVPLLRLICPETRMGCDAVVSETFSVAPTCINIICCVVELVMTPLSKKMETFHIHVP